MLFRTEKDKYGLDIVVATTADSNFAAISGLDWKETSSPVATGDFWFNGNIVKPGGEGYGAIEEIIFNKVEEENVIIRAAEEARAAEIARLMALAEESEDGSVTVVDTTILPPIPVPSLEERISEVKKLQIPVFTSLFSQPQPAPTLELVAEFIAKLADTNKMIAAIEGATDSDPYVCHFAAPVTFAEGTDHEHTVESLPIPDESIADFLAHWKKVKADQEAYIAHLKTVTGWVADGATPDDGGPDPE